MLLELAELHKTNPLKTSLTRDQRQHLSAILGSSKKKHFEVATL